MKIILFADNDRDFLDTRAEFLEQTGYQVLKAYTLEDARQLLTTEYLHLAILDMRMENDTDDKDVSGLTLAKDPAFRSVPKIILTNFPSYEAVRETLGPDIEGLPPAVGFVVKPEGAEALIQAVEQAFEKYVRINHELVIRFNPETLLSFVSLTGSLYPQSIGTIDFWKRAEELEDLFRKMFFENTEIYIDQVLWVYPGKIAVITNAYHNSKIEELVVIVGHPHNIQMEKQGYRVFGSDIARQGITVKKHFVCTKYFAGVAYKLVGCSIDMTDTFCRYYESHADKDICVALQNLFQVTMEPAYDQRKTHVEDMALDAAYREWTGLTKVTRDQFVRSIKAICQDALTRSVARIGYSPYRLTFPQVEGYTVQIANPAVLLFKGERLFPPPTLCGITAGCLYPETILVDIEGRTWITTFSEVELSPVLRDFVGIEAMIHFEVVKDMDTQTILEFEKRAVAPLDLKEAIPLKEDDPPAMQKAIRVLNYLRGLATNIPGSNAKEYYAGLLFLAAREISKYTPDTRHTEQELKRALLALIVAGLVCDKLTRWETETERNLPPEALTGLWVDETAREVWVEGHPVRVTKAEFDLLRFMYHRAGQVCDRASITEVAFGQPYQGKPIDNSRINTFVDRLRKKIEPDPSDPKYIITVRGVGYKLRPHGRD